MARYSMSVMLIVVGLLLPDLVFSQQEECNPVEHFSKFLKREHFVPVRAKPLSRASIHPETVRTMQLMHLDPDDVIRFARLDPKLWEKIIPDYVYSNAVVPPKTPLVQPLKTYYPNGTVFRHGTSKEAIPSIKEHGPWLSSGWGRVRAGFWLDSGFGNAAGFARDNAQAAALLEVAVDPEARAVKVSMSLYREFEKWLVSPEAVKALAEKHPEFMRLANHNLRSVSRDELARSLGAQVLVNDTRYGQILVTEVVILDPTVVRGVREIPVPARKRR